MRKRFMSWLIIPVAAYLALLLYVRLNERRFIYYPSRDLGETPARRGWVYEEVALTAEDGVALHGWFIPAAAPARADDGGPATLLVLHGNAGNISHRLDKLGILRDLGWDVLAIDYRGYGRSGGAPSEPGLYADARAAYRHLVGPRAVPAARAFLYGESLGSAVAVQLATEVAAGGVIIEEPFTSAVEVGQKMFPFLPVGLIARSRFDTLGKIGRIRAPLLVLHSREDEMFPLAYAERLLAAAPAPKELVVLHGSHNDAFLASAPVYRDALRRFVAAQR
jgi:uncharacterized protein